MTGLLNVGFIDKFENILSVELLLHFGYGSKQYYVTRTDTSITLHMKTHIVEFSSEKLQEIDGEFKNEHLLKYVKSFVSDLVQMY